MTALPWQDRSGVLSPVRAIACTISVMPLIWLVHLAISDGLGERPVVGAIHMAGDWAIRLLLITLSITPLRRITGWSGLIAARQIFGLASFAYALLHIALYALDLKFNLALLANEIVRRIYLGIGMVAFIGLAILAANSGVEAVRRLGGQAWNNLHKLVYPIALLGILHFFIQSRLNVDQPVLMAGFFVWLMGFRLLPAKAQTRVPALLVLACASAAATQLIELAWYHWATTVPVSRIASRIFDFSYDIRMMWVVLSTSLSVIALRIALGNPARLRPSRA